MAAKRATATKPRARALGSRYLLDKPIGAGAMGQVWRAIDQESGSAVAAKLLKEEFTNDTEIVARFVRERSILLSLSHPNIVQVHDLVVEGRDLAIVMDLVEGSDVRQLLRESGQLPPAEAVRIVAAVLRALAAAHEINVLHRDVKPDNVLLDKGEPPAVLLTDFSIARLAQETTVRMTGVLGTAEYIAPEILTSETVSAAADVYGAGIMLYELIAGRTPFAGQGNDYAVAHRHVTAEPPALEGLPPALWQCLSSMLEKRPEVRPNATEAADTLERMARGLRGVATLPERATVTTWRSIPNPRDPDDGIHVVGESGLQETTDPNQTSIRGKGKSRQSVGPVAAGVGAPGGLHSESSAEQLGLLTTVQPARRPRPAVDVPETAQQGSAEADGHRKRVMIAVVATVAVLVTSVGLFVGLRHHSHGGGSASTGQGSDPGIISAQLPAEAYPSGLTINRSATYAPKKKLLTATISYLAVNSTLNGDLLEVVPASTANTACPSAGVLQWTQVTPAPDANGIACGWTVSGQLQRARALTFGYSVNMSLPKGAEPQAWANGYLQNEAQATTKALQSLGLTPRYPIQRLKELTVRLDGPAVVTQVIPVKVLPTWDGASGPDNIDALYTTQRPTSDLARQFGGQVAIGIQGCSGGVLVSQNVLLARDPVSGCVATAQLGAIGPVLSDTFSVQQHP
jgi:serine/threonine protein kinase